ncbi:MAG: VOC family protein [Ilumatobacter sp.]|nr:VOC family protein [Ilumatobacter sp.]
MTVRTSYQHGTPSWIDLSTSDPDAARKFYGALFGWEFDVNPTDQGGDYIMARKGEHAAAGMMQQQPEQAAMGIPPMWNTYVTVDDIEATVGEVEGAGGSVMMPPMQVMEAGHMAVIADPTGAVVCLWQAEQHIGSEVVNEPGALCWNEVMTNDVPTASAFYSQLFGWGTDEMDMGEMGTYTVYMLGEDAIAGGTGLPPVEGVPPHWGTVFAVADCDATLEAVTANGGQVMAGPFDTPVGRSGACADPQGATFQIIQLIDA